jgi:uncharacterized protein YecE (DUF72 family)
MQIRFPIYIYFNNHYAGYAPGSVELFAKLWNEDPNERPPAPGA